VTCGITIIISHPIRTESMGYKMRCRVCWFSPPSTSKSRYLDIFTSTSHILTCASSVPKTIFRRNVQVQFRDISQVPSQSLLQNRTMRILEDKQICLGHVPLQVLLRQRSEPPSARREDVMSNVRRTTKGMEHYMSTPRPQASWRSSICGGGVFREWCKAGMVQHC
jgi:hypothetical protein